MCFYLNMCSGKIYRETHTLTLEKNLHTFMILSARGGLSHRVVPLGLFIFLEEYSYE